MKKIIGIGVVVVISMIISAVLFAAEPPRFNAQGRGAGFRTVGLKTIGFIDSDNDGVCDYCSNNSCTGFVDEDGDGVCDNWDGNTCGMRGGCGRNGTNGRGHGRGYYFTDKDNDGVCDNYTAPYGGRGFYRNF